MKGKYKNRRTRMEGEENFGGWGMPRRIVRMDFPYFNKKKLE